MKVDAALERLKSRLNQEDGFPHEIGIFLDYPVGDVRGFILNAGHNYKCKGCWKVYCNVELPLANLIGKGDYKMASRKIIYTGAKNAELIVERYEIRKGMRLHAVIRKQNQEE